MRFRPIAAILPILLAPVIAHAQTDPALLRFVPNDAKALISIDWKRVRQSPVGTMIRQKWVDGSAIPGVELLNDIDRVVISSQGRNPVDAPSPAEDAPMLIAVGGHFDLAEVREILSTQGAKPQMFDNVQVYRPQGTSGKEMGFLVLLRRADHPGSGTRVQSSRASNGPLSHFRARRHFPARTRGPSSTSTMTHGR